MPRYESGAIAHLEPRSPTSPTGTLFIQPRVDTRDAQNVLLDDVIGAGFAVLAWNNNPRALLGDDAIARWKALGTTFIAARPVTQLHWTGHDDSEVTIVGDRTGALKSFFDGHAESVLFLRPDRCIAGACIAQLAPEMSASLFDVLRLTKGGNRSREASELARPVLHVAQPAVESAGAVTGTA